MTGWAAVRSAANRGMRDPRPDPVDPRLPCPSLEAELDRASATYEDDPISATAPSECHAAHLDATLKNHVAAHGCRGLGSMD